MAVRKREISFRDDLKTHSFLSPSPPAKLSTAMAKKTFNKISERAQVKTQQTQKYDKPHPTATTNQI